MRIFKRKKAEDMVTDKDREGNQDPENMIVNEEQPVGEDELKKTADEISAHHTENKAENGADESPSQKIAALEDKYLRLYSEFENFRRRTAKERLDLFKMAGQEILLSFLPVLDDFDRAMKAIDASSDHKATKEGVELVGNKFRNILTQKGVKEIEAQGKEFDTEFHEAITKVPAPTAELKGKVIEVVEKGYLLNDKVIRFAKVIVGE